MKKFNLLLCALLLVWISSTGLAQKAATAPLKQPDFAYFLANVPVIQITMTSRDLDGQRAYQWQRAHETPRPVAYVTVREGTTVFTNVAFHLKGSVGSFRSIDDNRPAITLGFDTVDKKQRFHGFEKISLNNSVQDPTLMSEAISRQLYDKAGIAVPQAFHARVRLNGRDLGLYVMVEGWTKQFLKRHFEDPNGTLYDGGAARDIDHQLEVNSSNKTVKQTDLANLVAAARDPDIAHRAARIDKLLDVKEFIDVQVMDTILWNWDGYSMNHNNYRVYHDPKSDKIVFMPHGLDQMFQDPLAPIMPGGVGLLTKSVFQVPEWRKLYLERMAALLPMMDPVEINARIDHLSTRLQPYAPQVPGAAKHWGGKITTRIIDLQKQLEASRSLLTFDDSPIHPLTQWTNHTSSGQASFKMSGSEGRIAAESPSSSSWITTVWLTEGRYRLEGRAQVKSVRGQAFAGGSGAGLKVSSSRKKTIGPDWGWFPFRYASSSEMPKANLLPPVAPSQRLNGDADWTPLKYEFELRQPVMDLRLSCELNASAGEAVFDLASMRLVKIGPR